MGYGDVLMALGEAREIKKKLPEYKVLIGFESDYEDSPLYINNPYITKRAEIKHGDKFVSLGNCGGYRPYIDYLRTTLSQTFFKKYKPIPGDIFFTKEEKHFIETHRKIGDFVLIEPHYKKSCMHRNNKDWGWEKYQQIVLNNPDIKFVQLNYGKRLLDRVHEIRTTGFREALAVISLAKSLVVPEGGMHHGAAVFQTPSVVIFGGLISPEITGYDFHTNLYTGGEPCGSRYECDHCRKSMNKITVEQVSKSLREILDKHTLPVARSA